MIQPASNRYTQKWKKTRNRVSQMVGSFAQIQMKQYAKWTKAWIFIRTLWTRSHLLRSLMHLTLHAFHQIARITDRKMVMPAYKKVHTPALMVWHQRT